MKVRKYVVTEVEYDDRFCTAGFNSFVEKPDPITASKYLKLGRECAVYQFDGVLHAHVVIDLLQEALADIAHVRTDEPSEVAKAAIRIGDLDLDRDS